MALQMSLSGPPAIIFQPAAEPMETTQTFRITSSAAGTNATLVQAGPVRVVRIGGFNFNASPRYLKLYNTATVPVVGTDTPVFTHYLPPQETFEVVLAGAPLALPLGCGIAFTVGAADNATTGINAGDIMGLNLSYA